ncbi:MAG: hypothetical protein WBP61_01790 [Nocardioides sp.]
MKRLTVIALVLLAGCSQLQQDADAEAGRVADHVMPGALTDAISTAGARTPESRVAAAEQWLSDPGPSAIDSQGHVAWKVVASEGTSIRVDVYTYVESASFFPPDQGDATWGVACRSYAVAATVTTATVECPDGTPEEP